jgi:hypothetical protein
MLGASLRLRAKVTSRNPHELGSYVHTTSAPHARKCFVGGRERRGSTTEGPGGRTGQKLSEPPG